MLIQRTPSKVCEKYRMIFLCIAIQLIKNGRRIKKLEVCNDKVK